MHVHDHMTHQLGIQPYLEYIIVTLLVDKLLYNRQAGERRDWLGCSLLHLLSVSYSPFSLFFINQNFKA